MKLLLLIILFFQTQAHADKTIVHRIKSAGLKIVNFKNDLFFVKLKNKKLKVGTDYLVVRIVSEDRFDLMAQGRIEANQGRIAYLRLLDEQFFKQPTKGDYLVPIAAGVNDDDSGGKTDEGLLKNEELDYKEPGYIQVGYAYNIGDYATESSSLGNSAKEMKYNYTNFHLKWYFDFFWKLGFEYNFYSDDIPTSTYARRHFDSQREISDLKVYYRLQKWGDTKFRSIFNFNMLSDEFQTSNPDEFLLTTTYELLGFGKDLIYEFKPDMSELRGFQVFLSKIYLGAIYYPIVDVQDVGVSRGTKSKAQLSYNYHLGAEAVLFWDKIPYIKRWYLALSYESYLYDVKFSGPTVSENELFYKLPEGSETKELQNNIKIMFGFRLKDYIGEFFTPR